MGSLNSVQYAQQFELLNTAVFYSVLVMAIIFIIGVMFRILHIRRTNGWSKVKNHKIEKSEYIILEERCDETCPHKHIGFSDEKEMLQKCSSACKHHEIQDTDEEFSDDCCDTCCDRENSETDSLSSIEDEYSADKNKNKKPSKMLSLVNYDKLMADLHKSERVHGYDSVNPDERPWNAGNVKSVAGISVDSRSHWIIPSDTGESCYPSSICLDSGRESTLQSYKSAPSTVDVSVRSKASCAPSSSGYSSGSVSRKNSSMNTSPMYPPIQRKTPKGAPSMISDSSGVLSGARSEYSMSSRGNRLGAKTTNSKIELRELNGSKTKSKTQEQPLSDKCGTTIDGTRLKVKRKLKRRNDGVFYKDNSSDSCSDIEHSYSSIAIAKPRKPRSRSYASDYSSKHSSVSGTSGDLIEGLVSGINQFEQRKNGMQKLAEEKNHKNSHLHG